MDNICAIIVTYNIGKLIYKCFNSIKNQVDEVVIVDNGSDLETISELNIIRQMERVKVIFNGENKGIANALNIGVKYAINEGYKWVLTLDHDSEATPFMIKTMLKTYEGLPYECKDSIMIMTPLYIEKAFLNQNIEKSDAITNENGIIEEVTVITSGNLVKTTIFDIIGFYNENLFIDYVDHEFCLRIKEKGYKIVTVLNAYLLHELGTSQTGKFFNKKCVYTNHGYLRRYYITRNRIYVWKRYYRVAFNWVLHDMVAFLKETVKIIIYEDDKLLKLSMTYKGIRDNLKGVYGKLV